MNRQPNTIAQHVFEISYPHKEKAAALQQQLILLFKQKLYPALESYIDAHFDPDENIQIDSLVLNVGNIAIEDLDNGLSEKVMALFKDALKGYITNPYKTNVEIDNKAIVELQLKKSDIQLVEYYLINGTLPFWASGKAMNNPIEVVKKLLGSNPQLLIQLLLKIGNEAKVRSRISRQLSSAVISNIIKYLKPDEAEFIIGYHQELSKAQIDKQLVKAELSVFKQKAWEFFLGFLIIKQSSVFSQKMFVQNTLANIAAYFNISFDEIMRFFYEAVKSNGSSNDATTSLHHIILSIGGAEFDVKQRPADKEIIVPILAVRENKISLEEKQFEAIRYFLLNGVLPWWAKGNKIYAPENLFLQVSKEDVKQLITFFTTNDHIQQAAKNFSLLPINIIQAVITALEPTNVVFMIKYADELAKFVSKTINRGADKKSTQQKIWENIFHHLLNVGQSGFNETNFVNSVLQRLTAEFNVSPEVLQLNASHDDFPFLNEILLNYTDTFSNTENKEQHKSKYANYLKGLEYYLLKGTFPLWAFITNHTHATFILKELLFLFPAQTMKQIKPVDLNENTIWRLIKICDSNTLNTIVALALPQQSSLIATFLNTVFTMPIHVQSNLGINKEQLFKLVLEFLFIKKTNINPQDFLLHSFKILNQNNNVSTALFQVYLVQHIIQKNQQDEKYKELLEALAMVKPMLANKNATLKNVGESRNTLLVYEKKQLIVFNKTEENNSAFKDDKRALYDSIVDILKYFTLYETLPLWVDDNYKLTPEQLLEKLLLSDSKSIVSLLKFASANEKMMDFWFQHFSIRQIERALQFLPQSAVNSAITSLVLGVFKHHFVHTFWSVEKTEILILKTLWQAYNKTAFTKLDSTVFILDFIKQYEFSLSIPENHLRAYLLNKITLQLINKNFSWVANKLQLINYQAGNITQSKKQFLFKSLLKEYQLSIDSNNVLKPTLVAIDIFDFFIKWQRLPNEISIQISHDEFMAELIFFLSQDEPELLKKRFNQLIFGSTTWHLLFKNLAKNNHLADGYLQPFIESSYKNNVSDIYHNLKATDHNFDNHFNLNNNTFLWAANYLESSPSNLFNESTIITVDKKNEGALFNKIINIEPSIVNETILETTYKTNTQNINGSQSLTANTILLDTSNAKDNVGNNNDENENKATPNKIPLFYPFTLSNKNIQSNLNQYLHQGEGLLSEGEQPIRDNITSQVISTAKGDEDILMNPPTSLKSAAITDDYLGTNQEKAVKTETTVSRNSNFENDFIEKTGQQIKGKPALLPTLTEKANIDNKKAITDNETINAPLDLQKNITEINKYQDVQQEQFNKEESFNTTTLSNFIQSEEGTNNPYNNDGYPIKIDGLVTITDSEQTKLDINKNNSQAANIDNSQPYSFVPFKDITDFINNPNNQHSDDDYLMKGAEEVLRNFLLYNRLPENLSNSSTTVKDRWLKKLLVLIIHKKPSLLSYLLQQDNNYAQNTILMHSLFRNGQDIAERRVLTVLDKFIEKDISRVIIKITNGTENYENIRQILNQLKLSVSKSEWTSTLIKLIAANQGLAYILPKYLQAEEIYAIIAQRLSNEQAVYLRQLGILLHHTNLPSSDNNALLLLYHVFMLQYCFGSTRGNLIDMIDAFLSFVEKENNTILFRLFPILLNVVMLKKNELSFLQPISNKVEKVLIATANKAASNRLKDIPFSQRGQPPLLQPLTKPPTDILPKMQDNKITYPITTKKNIEPMNEKIYIHNAGLILFAPLLSTYFSRLSMLKNGKFISETETDRAVHLLEYIVDGLSTHDEHVLVLNKLLCNLPLSYAITGGIELTKSEIDVTEQLFGAIKQQWPQIKNSSFNGFRGSFLQRDGLLTLGEEGWNLEVEQKSYDVILQTLPWGYGMIKTPWMDKILTAEWI